MDAKRLTTLGLALAATAVAGIATAHDGHENNYREHSPIVKTVRAATAKYRDVNAALADGYSPGPCVSGRDGGAMGVHFAKPALIGDGKLDLKTPEVLIYEPLPGGHMRLVGVEYLMFYDEWHLGDPAKAPPVLGGQLFNYSGAPNRYAIPANYELHVWAWKHNPWGTFADWNPRVSCDHYEGGDAHAGH